MSVQMTCGKRCAITDASWRQKSDPRAIVTCGTAQRNRVYNRSWMLYPAPSFSMEKDTGMVCSGIDARYAMLLAPVPRRRAKTKSGNDGNSTSYSTQPDGMVTGKVHQDEPLVALAFKVQHDPQRGDVVLFVCTVVPCDKRQAAEYHVGDEIKNRACHASA